MEVNLIHAYLQELIAVTLEKPINEIDIVTGFFDLGLDSKMVTGLVRVLEKKIGHELYPTLLFEYQNIKDLSDYLLEEGKGSFIIPVKKEILNVEKISDDDTIIKQDELSENDSRLNLIDDIEHFDNIWGDTPDTNESFEVPINTKGHIAIIGLSGRYPGAKNLEEFWKNLEAGKDCITEIPKDRYGKKDFNYEHTKGKWGGFVDDVDKFDPLFFKIAPVDAELMDPQVRLFLEESWKAIEDAGYIFSSEESRNIGVFVGSMFNSYPTAAKSKETTDRLSFSTGWTIANRVSYHLGLTGPSMHINTACSSSLTSIIQACQSIQNGFCTAAIAGGVNLSLDTSKWDYLKTYRLLGSTETSRSFGQGDGYLPGEGVGAVLLKPLAQAKIDGDHIYGVIRGANMNHDGSGSGFTVPNPKAQTTLIKKSIEQSGLTAQDISYIEAAANGSALGDPIEIMALSNLFAKGDKKTYIGTVKSHIGHLESASGISGLTKVLLQMKYKTLVPGIHSQELNVNLGLERTSLEITNELKKWESLGNRFAMINNFGAGGSNAHIIIEEYVPNQRINYTSEIPIVIVLSASDEKRLKEQVKNLLNYLEENTIVNIYEIAYTLQVGRESMEERLSFVALDLQDIKVQLNSYIEGKTKGLFRGNIKKSNQDFLLEGEAGEAYIKTAISKKQTNALAQLWSKGVVLDWKLLYGDTFPSKISLPTYPFAKEHYWIPELIDLESKSSTKNLHPLLHFNSSNLKEQRFTNNYTGQELFFSDHKVMNEMVLPGVAYLEIAREAGFISLEKPITQLLDITWLSPVRVNGNPEEVSISLFEEDDFIGYEVYSGLEDSSIIHSQGKVSTEELTSVEHLDIENLQVTLPNQKTGIECYELFKDLGLDYGLSFRGIEKLYYGLEGSLSKISLIKEEGYVLQPGVLDSALQTCIGLIFVELDIYLSLPFSVKEVNIYGDVGDTSWCYARKSANAKSGGKVNSYDIDMLSDSGAVLLSFKNFISLPMSGFKKNDSPNKEEDVHLYSNTWTECSIVQSNVVSGSKSLILLAGGSVVLADKLGELLEEEVMAINESTELSYYHKVQKIVQSRLILKEETNITVIYPSSDYVDYGFISGLLKTAEIESSKIVGKTIGVISLSISELDSLVSIIKSEEEVPGKEVRYTGGKREVRGISMLPITLPSAPKLVINIKEGGVYLVTGGGGGLGQIFASHIGKTKNTKLILTGRSKKCALSPKELASLNAVYHSCDITDKESVKILISDIVNTYGLLDGIIHSAGIIKDSLLFLKTKDESSKVLAPKILGTKYLDELTKDLDLDFMVYFSSISGVTGNVGQGDYSSANAWMDNYANYRNTLREEGKRKGKTLSVNWPLWKDGGMQIDEESEKYLQQKWGMIPLPTQKGISAFDILLGCSTDQGVVCFGDLNQISEKILGKHEVIDEKIIEKELSSLSQTQVEIEDRLIVLISGLLKLNKEDFELDVDFSDYGVDSILMMNILNVIEESFRVVVEPTAIVNYPTIGLLAKYIQNETNYISQKKSYQKPLFNVKSKDKVFQKRDSKRKIKARLKPSSKRGKVAIIGMSCRLPESDTIEEFWDNLKGGKDLISDIPKNRWNAMDHYSETGEENKAYTTKGGFMKNPGLFDARYFGVSDVDAISMDPQQRIILELSRSLLAHSGYKKEEFYNSNTAVYIGAKDNNYVRNNYHLLPEGAHQHTIVNNISNMIAARISDFYNLKGTSQIIDTACSSSLVAIHQGCEDILQGKTDMVIAGGVSVMVDAFNHIGFSQAGVLSKDGKSYVFDEKAQGFVMGEGGGLVLLKSYEQAKLDGDSIYGVISGSSVNNDGKTMGLTVPNKEGQKQAIEQVLSKTNIDPSDITYYEAHGTGTLLGDPIEVKAATEVYQSLTRCMSKNQYCAIGSVKSNLGHTMTGAGVSGLIKILLQLQHKTLVPTLHCDKPHPRFKFEESPFYPNINLKPWDVSGSKNRKAAISSFGFGGTNCHMVIEEGENDVVISREPLAIECISNNYYWLGKEMIIQDVKPLLVEENLLKVY
ncbi:SDR family NAD(P)-dependent oxidoreductase [Aquimarina sp. I32.4]|uniref:SDR family NAD(P)-dependent oxidoreductase n=1 Tax=Aquimarina sp. I32.4 TaxID=2053903 RepID=UPI000CDEEF90|nr:SDR family NAD(P)-dependent oxidoreductase [Aquimarina sp. I32.4]